MALFAFGILAWLLTFVPAFSPYWERTKGSVHEQADKLAAMVAGYGIPVQMAATLGFAWIALKVLLPAVKKFFVWVDAHWSESIDFFVFSPFDSQTLRPIPKQTGFTPWVALTEGRTDGRGQLVAERDSLREWALSDCGDGRWGRWWPKQPALPRALKCRLITGPNCIGKTQLTLELGRELARRDVFGNLPLAGLAPWPRRKARFAQWRRDAAGRLRIAAWWRARPADEVWDAGIFIPSEDGLARLADWRPRRPTMIVLDDPPVHGEVKVTKLLAGNQIDFWHPVRLVIVDQIVPGELADVNTFLGHDSPVISSRLGETTMDETDLWNVASRLRDEEALSADALKDLWPFDNKKRCVAMTGGNPYLVAALLRRLIQPGVTLGAVERDFQSDPEQIEHGLRSRQQLLLLHATNRLLSNRVGELESTVKDALISHGLSGLRSRQAAMQVLACATLAGGYPLKLTKDVFGIDIGSSFAGSLGLAEGEGRAA